MFSVVQDQAIAIVTEVCEAHKEKSMQPETEGVCLLLLQILEKTLYLELCVSQSCGLRPVLGRIEDFSKEIKALVQGTSCFLCSAAFLIFSASNENH